MRSWTLYLIPTDTLRTHTHTHTPSVQSRSERRVKPRIRYIPDARRFQRLCRCYLQFSAMPLLIQLFAEIISQSAGGGGGDALLIAAHSQSRSPNLTHLPPPPRTLRSRARLYLCLPLHRLCLPDSFFLPLQHPLFDFLSRFF